MKRALVVDDNGQNRYLLKILLEGKGWSVDLALNGEQALDMARRNAPAVVISDLLMPVMDGYALLNAWKQDVALKFVPFIVYTATYTEPKDEQLALALGADAFLIKPSHPESILACVEAVIARVEGSETPRHPRPDLAADGLLSEYSETLVRKLEKRTAQLEQSNRELLDAIDALKRANDVVREFDERFRATFEQSAVGIAHMGMDGRFLLVNNKLCDILGHPREKLLQMQFTDLALESDLPVAEVARRAMFDRAPSVHSSEERYRRTDGMLVWLNLVSSPMLDQQGIPQYVISVFTDVTERRHLQDRLIEAQRLESIGRMTGGVAHDFNNLLSVIIGNSELLVDEFGSNARVRSLAEMSFAAAGRGAELTRRLLAFARRQPLQPCAVDVDALAKETAGMLRRLIPENVLIELALAPGPRLAWADPAQLESAILNLSVNARDAMPSGGCLTIETENVDIDDAAGAEFEIAAGPYVRLRVSDNGSGVPPDLQQRIFEPFFTTKPVGKGTGLGLSSVYGYIKQSGGHVTFESEPGRGTRVTLYLPAITGAPSPSSPPSSSLRGTELVLIVEDDDLVLRFGEQVLSSLGYRVLAASDGPAAMDILRSRNDIDLLFTDFIMPGGMNGRQLADAAIALRPELTVVICSGDPAGRASLEPERHATAQFLSKPYSRDQLARKLRETLAPGYCSG